MRIFLTGATGYIGSAVARTLKKRGHEVAGLARSPEKAAALRKAGLKAVSGDLKTPAAWAKQAAACDAVIHAGAEMGPGAAETDLAAIEGLLRELKSAGEARLFVYTSGVWVLGPSSGRPADEAAPARPIPVVAWRPAHEGKVLDAAGGALSAVVLRPGCVYGGRGGIYGMLIQSAVEKKEIRYPGDGSNCWAAVWRDDLAELYALLIEKKPKRAVFHATDEAAEPVSGVARALVEAAGGGRAEAWPLQAARKALGPFADALALDQRVSSKETRRELGWSPGRNSVVRNAGALVGEWKAGA